MTYGRGDPITPEQRAAAEELLADMLTTAARHGVTLDDFDGPWTSPADAST
ncbi:hypothetical protein [Streptomyces sp. NPDC087437]|uniref:hypothetical protein n=1 Tax=Streptomyces sp. NPDC087437 TaxID=3365789 RepID=UPI00382BFB5D